MQQVMHNWVRGNTSYKGGLIPLFSNGFWRAQAH